MMKKYVTFFSLAIAAAMTLSSCSEEEIPAWGNEDYARIEGPSIWTLNTDSMEYSFAAYPSSVTDFQVESRVYVEGKVANRDRTVYLKLNEGATTAPANSYDFPEKVVIPAGEYYADFNVTLHRIPVLQERKMRLEVALDDARSELLSGVKAWSKLTVVYSDMLSKPKNWNDLEEFFGASYSETKYRFIIDVVGFGEFTYLQTNGMSWGEMWNYRMLVVTALNEYNKANPDKPLTDENGQLVNFDN